MEDEELIEVPGVIITPDQLKNPKARALARAIEKRPYFELIECRCYEPNQDDSAQRVAASPDNERNEKIIFEYAEMTPQELDAIAKQTKQEGKSSVGDALKPLSPAWQNDPQEQGALKEQGDKEYVGEFVIFEVDTGVGQLLAHPIELTEPLVASFVFDAETTDWSNGPPRTTAMRRDFPIVPHLNARSDNGENHLLSLCLWDEPHQEVELKWTPALHLERISHWLKQTACGQLHTPDQTLEPLFFRAPSYLLVPPSLVKPSAEANQPVDASFRGSVVTVGSVVTFVADVQQSGRHQIPFATIILQAEPQTHGVIKHPPQNLAELQEYGERVGLNILDVVRGQLKRWISDKTLWNAQVVFVLKLPSRRIDQNAPEKHEVYGFTTLQKMVDLGVTLKLWELTQEGPVLLINQDKAGGLTRVYPLNVAPLLERETAQLFNAQKTATEPLKIVAIGAGAIGSQVFMTLARSGWGDWTVVDSDLFLPHNGARHALDGADLGHSKAHACCRKANSLYDQSFRATPIIASVNGREDPNSQLAQAMMASELILDFSASISAARILSDTPNPCARRISVFLNPVGNQLLILAEDDERNLTLTDLEMQLWRAIVTHEDWSNYYDDVKGERVRYARSCGDASARVSQDFVALHSAGAARAIRQLAQNKEATLMRWNLDGETGEVQRTQWTLAPMQEWQVGQWRVRASEDVMQELWKMRRERLPMETGGILLGLFDSQRKIAHLVAALPAPPDSEECRDSFLRGHQGLHDAVKKAEALSGGTVSYLGEWHSHPDGFDATRSARDYQSFSYLKEWRDADGLPPVMLILADKDDCAWFVNEMTPPKPEPTVIILVRQL